MRELGIGKGTIRNRGSSDPGKCLMGRACAIVCWVTLLWVAPAFAQETTQNDALRARLVEEAEKIVFSDRCGECHAAEFEVWEQTSHATGFDTLHTTDRAKEVYEALGLRKIKRGSEEATPACLECHYTPTMRRGVLRAGAGVTCESCHGPARDWVEVHNSYDAGVSDQQEAARLETPEHRVQRIADSRAAGMRRPSDLYDVAANCFGCHTVPEEELVNVAGHTTGSDLELVDWNEQIRHNFLESYKTADGRTNAERSSERKRVMYVAGRALDIEYSLRGVAVATEDERYFSAMSDRAGAAIDELYYLNDIVAISAVETIIDIFDRVELKPNNREALLMAADAIGTATRSFIAGSDGTELAAVDPLWNPDIEPPADDPTTAESAVADLQRAEPSVADPPALPVQRPVTEVAVARTTEPIGLTDPPAPDPPRGTAAPGRDVSPPVEPTPPPAAVESPPAAPAPQYEVFERPPWRDPPEHGFEKVPCGKCHSQQDSWWRKDAHKGTVEALKNGDPEAVEIALRYGIDPAEMTRGSQTCMWCHGGKVISPPTRKIRDPVGCQRCHGAGTDYLEPHETESYAQSVERGLTALKTPAVRADTCAGCHYITDPGLIAAGHATGADFDILARQDEIRHWGGEFGRETEDDVAPTALSAAYAAVIDQRGPPPEVAPVRLPEPTGAVVAPPAGVPRVSDDTLAGGVAPPTGGAPPGDGRPPSVLPGAGQGQRAPPPPTVTPAPPPRTRPASVRVRVAPSRPALVGDPQLDRLVVDPDASPEETLLQLRTRLDALYRALGRAPPP